MSQDNKMNVDYTKWEINGNTLHFDAADAKDAQRYEEAMDFLRTYDKQIPKVGKNSDRIIAYCNGFYKLFDMIFGEGTGEKIFGGKKNINLCHNTLGLFLAFVAEQKKGVDEAISGVTSYANRATRRAAQKKSKK